MRTNQESERKEIDLPPQELLQDLTKVQIPKYVPGENIHCYTPPWKPEGVAPQKHDEHGAYLRKFCSDVVDALRKQIDEREESRHKELMELATLPLNGSTRLTSAVKESSQKSTNKDVKIKTGRESQQPFGHLFGELKEKDFLLGRMSMRQARASYQSLNDVSSGSPGVLTADEGVVSLYAEVLHHLHQCRRHCKVFSGREAELHQLQDLLTHHTSGKPLIVHAGPGQGKSAFMAEVATQSKKWLGEHCVTVIRFLGMSSQSATLRRLLSSVCHQICTVYGLLYRKQNLTTVSRIVKYFHELLLFVSLKFTVERPLVIMLDSVSQLLPRGGAHMLSWLPTDLPSGVSIVLSIRSEPDTILQHARQVLCNDSQCFLQLPPTTVYLKHYVSSYLASKHRTLTAQQETFLLQELEQRSHPLLRQLTLDLACSWHSYTDITSISLPGTVSEAITDILVRLEKKFGQLFVEAVLSYITLSQRGITECEIEDALSCNDLVLSEVYKYHNPPVEGMVRIPELMWSRFQHELEHYLVNQKAQGKTTIYWKDAAFADVVTERYLKSEEQQHRYHSHLVEIFQAENSIRRTIHLSERKLTVENADRMVTPQPLTSQNKRKLVCLPYHLYKMADHDSLKHQCLCNLQFIHCYIAAFSVYEFLSVFTAYVEKNQSDDEARIVTQCLRYSDEVIARDLSSLPVQLLGQLLKYAPSFSIIHQLCKDSAEKIKASDSVSLLPVLGSIPSATSLLKWYTNGPVSLSQGRDCWSHVLLHCTDNSGKPALYRVLNTDTLEQISCTFLRSRQTGESPRQFDMTNDGSDTYVYALFSDLVEVCKAGSSGSSCQISTIVKQGRPLSDCMLVSQDGSLLALAGPDRLALYDSKLIDNGTEKSYIPRAVMNLAASSKTSNLIFSSGMMRTISSHAIKGQKSLVGAVVMWDYGNQTLTTRLPLPSPVLRGFLYLLPPLAEHDIILCGCQTGQIFIIDMEIGKIIAEVGSMNTEHNKKEQRSSVVLSSLSKDFSLLLTGTQGSRAVDLWDVDISVAGHLGNVELPEPVHSICAGVLGRYFYAGTIRGNLCVYKTGSNTLLRVIPAHTEAIQSVTETMSDQLITCGPDRLLKVWDVEALCSAEDKWKVEGVADTEKVLLENENILGYSLSESNQLLVTGKTSTTGLILNINISMLLSQNVTALISAGLLSTCTFCNV